MDEEDVEVIRDRRRDFGEEIVRIRVLRVPASKQFPEGIKYAFHYGRKDSDTPLLRYDNHHGIHERHVESNTEEIDFPGTEALLRRFVHELPDHISP
jgi:hypothetical protein